MKKERELLQYEAAAAVLPVRLRKPVLDLPIARQKTAEEFRLRTGRPITVLVGEKEIPLETEVMPEELETLCDLATDFSRYAAAETLRDGYLTVRGGCRIGLCGTAVMKDGSNTNLKNFSSAVVRIAREQRGIAEPLAPKLFRNERLASALILSPPGGGKTTLLRDLVRCISNGVEPYGPRRVALIDERGEVAVMARGEAQMDVGIHTDVLDACPKALGIPMVLRVMNPQVIALDEITQEVDLRAVSLAAGCGVSLLATIHASDTAELLQKPLYRQLLNSGVFRLAICISRGEQGREYRVEELP